MIFYAHACRKPKIYLSQSEALALKRLEEFMRKFLDGNLTRAALGATMGYCLHEFSEGRACFVCTPRVHGNTTPMGTVHGGWYGTFA